MTSLSEVLSETLTRLGLEKALVEAKILAQWDSLVGPMISAHARPEQIRFNKLYVRVDSPAWFQELTLLKPSLLQKLNDALGKDSISDLVLRFGNRPASR
jgi:predicted nucleic acid-binding Zn ribbon protein